METLIYQALEKNNELNLYRKRITIATRHRHWIIIWVDVALILFSILSITGTIKFLVNQPAYFDGMLVGTAVILLLFSIWVFRLQIPDIRVNNINEMNSEELEAYIEKIIKRRKEARDSEVVSVVDAIFMSAAFIFLIISIATKSSNVEGINLMKNVFTKEGSLISILLLMYMLISQLLVLVFSPQLRKDSKKRKLFDKINLSFLTCIDDSPINPTYK